MARRRARHLAPPRHRTRRRAARRRRRLACTEARSRSPTIEGEVPSTLCCAYVVHGRLAVSWPRLGPCRKGASAPDLFHTLVLQAGRSAAAVVCAVAWISSLSLSIFQFSRAEPQSEVSVIWNIRESRLFTSAIRVQYICVWFFSTCLPRFRSRFLPPAVTYLPTTPRPLGDYTLTFIQL